MPESARPRRAESRSPQSKKESARERHDRMLGHIDAVMAAIDAALEIG